MKCRVDVSVYSYEFEKQARAVVLNVGGVETKLTCAQAEELARELIDEAKQIPRKTRRSRRVG